MLFLPIRCSSIYPSWVGKFIIWIYIAVSVEHCVVIVELHEYKFSRIFCVQFTITLISFCLVFLFFVLIKKIHILVS